VVYRVDDRDEIHYATPIINAEGLDTLPEEDNPEYELTAQFRGYIRQSRISVGHGDMLITIGVPFEDKYLAMPVTDLRGVVFMIGVYRPKRFDVAGNALDVGSEVVDVDAEDSADALGRWVERGTY
jgi:hypothetical protein